MVSEIVNLRRMTKREAKSEGWDTQNRTAPVLVLSDGSRLYPSSDEEGNSPGALFGIDSKGKHFSVSLSVSRKKLKRVM